MSTDLKNYTVFDIKRYSDDVQTIMKSPPRWIIRYGIAAIFLFILIILISSYFIRYPDITKASFVLSSYTPSVRLIAKEQGRAQMLVRDKDMVKKDQLLGYIENTARFDDVQYYMTMRDSLRNMLYNNRMTEMNIRNDVNLGELQSSYINFLNLLYELKEYARANKLDKYLESIDYKQSANRELGSILQKQQKIIDKQYELGRQKFMRDSLLYEQQVISKQDFENARNNLLPAELSKESSRQNLESLEIQKAELENRRYELIYQENKFLSDLRSKLILSFNDLDKNFLLWRDRYAFISPIAGRITLFGIWSNNQNIQSGQEVISISHLQNDHYGYATLPVEMAGKVKEGQKVNISFSSYPGNEYGFVTGKVASISSLPQENKNYFIRVSLNDGLTTDIGKTIDYREQMVGEASIITEDLRLIERFYYNIRKVLTR